MRACITWRGGGCSAHDLLGLRRFHAAGDAFLAAAHRCTRGWCSGRHEEHSECACELATLKNWLVLQCIEGLRTKKPKQCSCRAPVSRSFSVKPGLAASRYAMHHPLHQGTLLLKPGSPAGAWRAQQFQGLKAAESVPQNVPEKVPRQCHLAAYLATQLSQVNSLQTLQCRVHTLPHISRTSDSVG